jgi:REP element-mobilizing transposase RayT
MPSPLYTADNVRIAYQLNWSLAVFWNQYFAPSVWFESLQAATEQDGVRILEHRTTKPNVSLFLLSTKPHVSPAQGIRSVKGRLQYLVRAKLPKAFRRNYSLHSLGSANQPDMEQYVASQTKHHPMADSRVQSMLARYQFCDRTVDLAQTRRRAYGQFIYNLHLVLVHRDRDVEIREECFRTTRDMLRAVARKKNHRLSRVGLLADHVHWTIGCGIQESPLEVGLTYASNLAFAHGMRAVFQFGFYVGTFGPYDWNAVRRSLAGQSSSRRDKLGGDEAKRDPPI